MQDNAAFVSSVVAKLADAGKSILMVTHPYGGIPGTEGSKFLSKKERIAAGKPGGVVRVLYVTSLVARVGESLVDRMGSQVTPFLRHEVNLPRRLQVQLLSKLMIVKGDYMSHGLRKDTRCGSDHKFIMLCLGADPSLRPILVLQDHTAPATNISTPAIATAFLFR